MSIASNNLPKVSDQLPYSVFLEKPPSQIIDENSVTKYATSQKIETLIEELRNKGPLVALAQIGPNCYADKPFKLKDQILNQDIYGWKPDAKRNDHSSQSYALILGAKKTEQHEYVYFTLSEDITLNRSTAIREHRPSNIDTKIYVTSHKTFRNYLCDLYPPKPSQAEKLVYFISSKPKIAPKLNTVEQKYADQLSSIMPLESILDQGKGESACKAIGQEIFEKYKAEAGGSSLAGKEAAQKICNAVTFMGADGALRKQYIERAWDGIGDENWRWRA